MNKYWSKILNLVKSKDLVLVETPFQLLCAYEYVRKNSVNYALYIRTSGVGINDQQMVAMVRELGLVVSKELRVRPGNKIDVLSALLIFLLSGFRFYDKVIVGSFFSGFQKLISGLVQKKEIVLLDDGVATLLADKIIADQGVSCSAFSIFELNKKNYVNFELNRFELISNDYSCELNDDYCSFFIGQKLVDIGAMDMAAYIRVLEFAVRESSGSVMHYIPHRAESRECLESVSKIAGVHMLKSDVAIEYFMLRNKWYPDKIYSVNSTALFTLASIFPKASTVAICSNAMNSEMFKHHSMIMNAFESHKSITISYIS